MNTVDMQFTYAVRSAFEAFRKYANHFRKPEQMRALAPLVELLRREDFELGIGEREYLADLLAGEMGQHRGRPRISWREGNRRDEIIIRVFELEQTWKAEGRKLPYRQKACQAVTAEINAIAQKARVQRVTAPQIIEWMDHLKPAKRAALLSLASNKSRFKLDTIYSG